MSSSPGMRGPQQFLESTLWWARGFGPGQDFCCPPPRVPRGHRQTVPCLQALAGSFVNCRRWWHALQGVERPSEGLCVKLLTQEAKACSDRGAVAVRVRTGTKGDEGTEAGSWVPLMAAGPAGARALLPPHVGGSPPSLCCPASSGRWSHRPSGSRTNSAELPAGGWGEGRVATGANTSFPAGPSGHTAAGLQIPALVPFRAPLCCVRGEQSCASAPPPPLAQTSLSVGWTMYLVTSLI